MNDTLVRLAWALPLVLLLGVGAVWVLKRAMLQGADASAAPALPMSLSQTLHLSDDARLHLVNIGTHALVVVESGHAPVVHALPAPIPPIRAGLYNRWRA